MTLVIAGFERSPGTWRKTDVETTGLFAVADSLITTHGRNGIKPILSGLRKVHGIPVKLWKPYFIGPNFKDYLQVHQETECFVALAGSTLVATHALNLITAHLAKLRISFDLATARSSPDRSGGTYVVRRDCEHVEVRDSQEYIEWGDDMFVESLYAGLLNADVISKVVVHSIRVAFKSAMKYCLDISTFEDMRTDLAMGVQCPGTGRYRLFVYRMGHEISANGLLEVTCVDQELREDELAVLGMRSFEARAKEVFEGAIHHGKSTGAELFEFLNSAIDEIGQTGDIRIDRPASHKRLRDQALKTVNVRF